MNTNLKKTIASGIIGLTALGGTALALPGLASAQDDVTPDAEAPVLVAPEVERESRADRLQGLVDDGTITQEQADAIQDRIGDGDRRSRGHHRGQRDLTPLTDALGITADELRESLSAGDTLADVAAAQGVSVDALTDMLVAEKEAKVAEKVAAGDITQEQADEKLAQIEERVTAKINGEQTEGRRGGLRGFSGFRGFGNGDGS